MREISLNGYIDDEIWFGDEITPDSLHEALYGPDNQFTDDVHIRLNSYGGSCNAATRMFDDIRAYPGNVTITISGTAASAATVLAMAANRLEMTPGSLYMIHNPSTVAWGDERDLEEAKQLLRACKESILNIYSTRCKLIRDTVSAMMTATTWMDAHAALQHGFIDGIAETVPGISNSEGIRTVNRKDAEVKVKAWLERHRPSQPRRSTDEPHNQPETEVPKPADPAFSMPAEPEAPAGTPVDQLRKRLDLIRPIR